MVDDHSTAQARELLRELRQHALSISQKLDAVENCRRRTSARGAMLQRRQSSSLRRELHEARRLIDGLHRQFPDALTTERVGC
ncbi:hypothetical protein [Mycobacterium antarcticum]|uniref:hypothetical protein n=1 Tax=unclassified Mycolicibacterium TaxID=2636767 RepID=UPI0024E094E3|nr:MULTISPECIES: hypothetical protein [unclassified Mycolicibacterium]